MIPILLRDLRWRLLALAAVAMVMYFLEPGFHQHEAAPAPDQALALGPLGISATLSYLAGVGMIILLGGFISTDRREGYAEIHFSHPTAPLALYALRWGIAFVVVVATAALFLIIGQIVAWGEFRGGWSGLALAAVSAVVYGGIVAFLSALLTRGDGWIAALLFLPTLVPQALDLGLQMLPAALRGILAFLLPPHGALQAVWQAIVDGGFDWSAAAFALGYGAVWIGLAIVLVQTREWG